MGRTPCCDKTKVKRGPWSPEEDQTLKNYLHKNGTGGNWITLPQKAGLKRCGKSCRLRWLNYLRPDIKHGPFTPKEDNIIYTLYRKLGSRWSIIASQLPGRTDNDVKNHWNSKLKKLMAATAINKATGNINDDINAYKTTYCTSTSTIQLCLETNAEAYSPNFPALCTQTPPEVPFLADDCTEFSVSTEGSKFCSSSSSQPQEDSIISESTSFGPISNSMPWSDDYVDGLPMEMSTAYSYEIMSGIWLQETVPEALQSPYFTSQFIN